MVAGRLGKAAAVTVTPEFTAAAEGGGSGLALLLHFRGARDPAARGEQKRLPVNVNTWGRTDRCHAAGSAASRG